MAVVVDDSKIAQHFLPSLSHLGVVKMVVVLFNEFGGVKYDILLKEIKTEDSEGIIEFSEKINEGIYKKSRKNLGFIPRSLRRRILDAVNGMRQAVANWENSNYDLYSLKKGKIAFKWKSDGSIDTIKTVQQLVLDETIAIRTRFQIACNFGLKDSIASLWRELKASGKTSYDSTYNAIERFWIKWIDHFGLMVFFEITWDQVAAEFFKLTRRNFTRDTRFSSMLSLLHPRDRENNLFQLHLADNDDFQSCVRLLTKQEEGRLLQRSNYVLRILCIYLRWPHQSLFLEKAERALIYIDETDFKKLVSVILRKSKIQEDFDYCALFEIFWENSPDHLQQSAKEDPDLRKEIDSCFYKMRRRRESLHYKQLIRKPNINSDKKRKREGDY